MATSTSMKTTLVLMLLLSAVVASHAHQVKVKNSCKKPIKVNGVWIAARASVVLLVKVKVLVIEAYDFKNVKHTIKYKCGENVWALNFFEELGWLKVKINPKDLLGDLGLSAGLVASLLNVVGGIVDDLLQL